MVGWTLYEESFIFQKLRQQQCLIVTLWSSYWYFIVTFWSSYCDLIVTWRLPCEFIVERDSLTSYLRLTSDPVTWERSVTNWLPNLLFLTDVNSTLPQVKWARGDNSLELRSCNHFKYHFILLCDAVSVHILIVMTFQAQNSWGFERTPKDKE